MVEIFGGPIIIQLGNKLMAKLRLYCKRSFTFKEHKDEAQFLDLSISKGDTRYSTRTYEKDLYSYSGS